MSSREHFRARITAIREYFPSRIVTNQDMEKMVETTHEWIVERTGIHERRLGEAHETPAFMGSQAAKTLLQDLSISPESIDVLIVATITGDYVFPSTACLIQAEIGATRAFGYDLSAACSGFIYGLETSRAYIESGRAKRVLLIAAEKMSSIIDYTDRQTCVIFGDGGSATLIEPSTDGSGIIDSIHRMDGTGVSCLFMPAGGSRKPPSEESVRNREHFVKQEGRTVFKRAVTDMANVCVELLQKNNLTGNDIQLFVPHQANIRIIESVADRLQLPKEKIAVNIDRYGNTTASTIPTALYQSEQKGQVKKGDLVLLASFGAGFTWGATLLRY